MPIPSFSTLIDLFEATRDAHPDKGIRLVSPTFSESYYPYAEIHRRILFHAEHLRAQEIEPGQRIVIPLSTDIDIICSFLALIWMGAVPISISGQMAGQDRAAYLAKIRDLIERYQLDRLIVDADLARAIEDEGSIDPRLLADPSPPGADPDRPPPRIAPARVREDDVAFVQFSSGSTSEPRGIQITHRNICNNLRLIVANDGRTAKDTGVAWIPLYHDMGLVGGFFSNFVQHCPLVLMNPVCFLMKPIAWLDYISRYQGAITAAPNFAFDMCNTRIRDQQLEQRRPDLGSLSYAYNGSEPVSAEVIERFYERFAPYGARRGTIYPVYGMAEATLIVSAPDRGSPLVSREVDGARVVSVGRPLGDVHVKIIGKDGPELPTERVGEIVVRGSSVTPGYFENEEETRRRFRDGWLHTGDLGLLDEQGRLYITGRLKDLIIVNGRNYYAHDIAAKLQELPFVKRGKTHVFSLMLDGREQVIVMTVLASSMTSSVRGKVDELKKFLSTEPGAWILRKLGEKTELFVRDMPPHDVEALKDEIKRYLLREFGLPIHDVFIVPNIPRTSSGKVRRGECEALYLRYRESGTSSSAAPLEDQEAGPRSDGGDPQA